MKIRREDIRECRRILHSRLAYGPGLQSRELMSLNYLQKPVNELATLLYNRVESRISESALLVGATAQEREYVLYEALNKLYTSFENLENDEKEDNNNIIKGMNVNTNSEKKRKKQGKRKRKLKCAPLIVSIDASLHTTDVQAFREITWQLTKRTEFFLKKKQRRVKNQKTEIESNNNNNPNRWENNNNANENDSSSKSSSVASLTNFAKDSRMIGGTLGDIDILIEKVRQGKLGSDNPIILILNRFEIFAHEKKQLLLYNLVDLLHNSSAHVIIIGVAASFSAKDTLEKRVYSRLFPKMITLKTPTSKEVLSILDRLLLLPTSSSSSSTQNSSTTIVLESTTTLFIQNSSKIQDRCPQSQECWSSSRQTYFRIFNEKWNALRSEENTSFHDWINQWFDFHYYPSTFLNIFLTVITHISVENPFLTLPLLMKAHKQTIPSSFPPRIAELCAGLSENEILFLATLLRMQSRGFVGVTLRDLHQEVKRNISQFSNYGNSEATLSIDNSLYLPGNMKNESNFISTSSSNSSNKNPSPLLNNIEKNLENTIASASSFNREGPSALIVNPCEQHTYNLQTFRRSFFRLYGWRGLSFVPRPNISTMSLSYQDFQCSQNLGVLPNMISPLGGIDHLPIFLTHDEELKTYFKSTNCITQIRRWALNLGD